MNLLSIWTCCREPFRCLFNWLQLVVSLSCNYTSTPGYCLKYKCDVMLFTSLVEIVMFIVCSMAVRKSLIPPQPTEATSPRLDGTMRNASGSPRPVGWELEFCDCSYLFSSYICTAAREGWCALSSKKIPPIADHLVILSWGPRCTHQVVETKNRLCRNSLRLFAQ